MNPVCSIEMIVSPLSFNAEDVDIKSSVTIWNVFGNQHEFKFLSHNQIVSVNVEFKWCR